MSAATVRIDVGFDIEGFLAEPLVARVAAAGPSVRAVWFLWEDRALALVVDTRDVGTGEVLQLSAEAEAEIYQLDAGRAHRILQRYLGADASLWPQRFKHDTFDDPATRLIRLEPGRLRARDLSYDVL